MSEGGGVSRQGALPPRGEGAEAERRFQIFLNETSSEGVDLFRSIWLQPTSTPLGRFKDAGPPDASHNSYFIAGQSPPPSYVYQPSHPSQLPSFYPDTQDVSLSGLTMERGGRLRVAPDIPMELRKLPILAQGGANSPERVIPRRIWDRATSTPNRTYFDIWEGAEGSVHLNEAPHQGYTPFHPNMLQQPFDQGFVANFSSDTPVSPIHNITSPRHPILYIPPQQQTQDSSPQTQPLSYQFSGNSENFPDMSGALRYFREIGRVPRDQNYVPLPGYQDFESHVSEAPNNATVTIGTGPPPGNNSTFTLGPAPPGPNSTFTMERGPAPGLNSTFTLGPAAAPPPGPGLNSTFTMGGAPGPVPNSTFTVGGGGGPGLNSTFTVGGAPGPGLNSTFTVGGVPGPGPNSTFSVGGGGGPGLNSTFTMGGAPGPGLNSTFTVGGGPGPGPNSTFTVGGGGGPVNNSTFTLRRGGGAEGTNSRSDNLPGISDLIIRNEALEKFEDAFKALPQLIQDGVLERGRVSAEMVNDVLDEMLSRLVSSGLGVVTGTEQRVQIGTQWDPETMRKWEEELDFVVGEESVGLAEGSGRSPVTPPHPQEGEEEGEQDICAQFGFPGVKLGGRRRKGGRPKPRNPSNSHP